MAEIIEIINSLKKIHLMIITKKKRVSDERFSERGLVKQVVRLMNKL